MVTSVETGKESEVQGETLVDVEPLVFEDQPGAAPKVEARLDEFAPVVDIIGGIYFSGLYHNSGEAVITYPKVTVYYARCEWKNPC
ncbi:MAG: hypothetical protein PF637_09500 [Spirochaetes bacterium]|jgi:hypothetical protein|nr:hypothetical protein [Spirochaetota bacterium]